MVDEVKTETPVVKDSANTETPQTEGQSAEREYTDQEQSAMLLGWIPEDKYDGSKEQFRSAREFLERGEMIGKIRSLSKQNNEISRAIQHMSSQNAKIYENGYKAALTDLKAEKRAALAEGDLVKADEVQDKIESLKENQANNRQAVPAITQTDPDHEAWVAQNAWYDTNKVLRNFADSLAVEYVHVNKGQVSAADVRDYVSKTVKEEFAHRFGAKQVVGAPNPDSSGRQSAKPGSSSNQLSALKASLSESDRDIMKTVLKTTGMSEAEYLKQYQGA
jgi:hypothetical protein